MLISKAFKTEVAAAALILLFAASVTGKVSGGEFAQQISQLYALEQPANRP